MCLLSEIRRLFLNPGIWRSSCVLITWHSALAIRIAKYQRRVLWSLCENFPRTTRKIRTTRHWRLQRFVQTLPPPSSFHLRFIQFRRTCHTRQLRSLRVSRFFNAAAISSDVHYRQFIFARGKNAVAARAHARQHTQPREMLSRFCRRHHLSRRKAPCITSGVYPRSRHPVVTTHLLPPLPPPATAVPPPARV